VAHSRGRGRVPALDGETMIARVGLAGLGAGSLAPGGSPTGGEYYGAGGSWVNVGGCFFGRESDWPAFQRAYLCSSPYSSCTVPCPSDTCGGGNAAACPGYQAPAAPAPSVQTPAPGPASAPKVVTVEIQTPEGAVSVQMPEDYIPGTADHDLTPARVRIPNIWDSLDPTKQSQFAYRGVARSLPVWISKEWRETLSAAAATPAPAVDPLAAAAEMPFLAFVAIGAACWMLRDKKGKR